MSQMEIRVDEGPFYSWVSRKCMELRKPDFDYVKLEWGEGNKRMKLFWKLILGKMNAWTEFYEIIVR